MRFKTIFVVTLIILALGVGYFFYVQKRNTQTQFVVPVRGPIVEAVYGIGTVTAEKHFELKIGIAMKIRKLFVKEGDTVKSGKPLVLLDSLFLAPINGTVTSLPFKVSETVFPQTNVLQITDLKDRYILVSLEQQGALRIKPGQLAKLSFESLRKIALTGVVRRIYPNDGQFYVRIDIESLPKEILPGMTADVAIEVAKRDDALLVPASAIAAGKLAIIRNGKKQKVAIDIGSVDGEMAEIISGDVQLTDHISVKK